MIVRNKNYNQNIINIPKNSKKKRLEKIKEEQDMQEQDTQTINPSIFGYNTTPITYQPLLEPIEQVAIEREPVEDFATAEVIATPNEEEMRMMRDEYYADLDEGVTKEKDFYMNTSAKIM
jgi:hypothetical protein